MHLQSAQLDETEHVKSLRKLELFAYGKWSDYRDSQISGAHQYTELNELQAIKLKQLTIVSLAEQNKVCRRSSIKFDLIHVETCFCLTSRLRCCRELRLPPWDMSNSITSIFSLKYFKIITYETLLKELDIDSVRVLEDLIIETMYAVSSLTYYLYLL